jgi:hypothetical protein
MGVRISIAPVAARTATGYPMLSKLSKQKSNLDKASGSV